MNSSIRDQLRYITNAAGEHTDVLVPVALWEQLIGTLRDPESGLAWVDEYEPKTQLLADLQASFKEAAAGQTFPVSQLWNDLDAES